MFFINGPLWFNIAWVISGLLFFFFSATMRSEMQACLKNGKLFHFFGGILYALFLAVLFGPLAIIPLYLVNRALRQK